MQLSARNQLPGRISAIRTGSIMAEVDIELPGGLRVVAAITRASVERLALEVGDEVSAVIKSTEVMVAK